MTRERLELSARRLLELKARAGLHINRFTSFEEVGRTVGKAAHVAYADSVASRSIVLVKDSGTLVPLTPTADRRVLSITYARPIEIVAGRTFDAELRLRMPNVDAVRVSDETGPAFYSDLDERVGEADVVIVHAYVPPRAGSGTVGISEDFQRWLSRTAQLRPVLLVSLGNPYLLRDLPEVDSYVVAWGNHEVSQHAAIRALFGEAAISARLPITIPPSHPRGSGLSRDQVRTFTRVAARDPLAEAGILPGRRDSLRLVSTAPPDSTDSLVRPAPELDVNRRGAGSTTSDTVPVTATQPRQGDPALIATDPPADARPEFRLPPAGRVDASATYLRPTGATAPTTRRAVGRGVPMRISTLEETPSEVGMSEAVLAELDSTVVAAIASGASPGAVVAVGRRGKLVRLRGYGWQDTDTTSAPVDEATLYDLASLTKVVGTTTAAMILLERGQLSLDARVVEYLPWWGAGDPAKSEVTVRHLMLHRAGLPPFRRFYTSNRGKAEFQNAIGALALDYPPGTRTVYSDIGLMTLGFIIEAQTGMSLDQFLHEEAWSRLGMQDTGFNPDLALLSRIAPTEIDTLYRDGKVHGEVHDENAHAIGGVAGHAGLFGSARDLAVFADMMLRGGTLNPCTGRPASGVPCSTPRSQPVTLVNASTIRLFTRRADGTSSRALGWDTPSGRSSAGDYFTSRSFGHTGFTGTSIWMDPERDLFVIVLTNRVNPTRENSRHVSLRRAIADLATLAIVDASVEKRP